MFLHFIDFRRYRNIIKLCSLRIRLQKGIRCKYPAKMRCDCLVLEMEAFAYTANANENAYSDWSIFSFKMLPSVMQSLKEVTLGVFYFFSMPPRVVLSIMAGKLCWRQPGTSKLVVKVSLLCGSLDCSRVFNVLFELYSSAIATSIHHSKYCALVLLNLP